MDEEGSARELIARGEPGNRTSISTESLGVSPKAFQKLSSFTTSSFEKLMLPPLFRDMHRPRKLSMGDSVEGSDEHFGVNGVGGMWSQGPKFVSFCGLFREESIAARIDFRRGLSSEGDHFSKHHSPDR